MLLYCVRHGESLYNAEGRVQGQSDVALSEFGRSQSAAVAEALAEKSLDALYSSPLRRAMETAEVVARRTGLPIQTDPRLKEVNAGIFQDRLRADLQREFPEELSRWTSEDLDYVIPGGESRRQLIARGRAALEAIARENLQHVAVIAHGRLLTVALKNLVGLAPEDYPRSLENGSITTIRCDGAGRFEVLDWDRVDHLDGVGLAGSGDL
jgi:2,3-bisphosphoglycerate-dependent phosphoglycerate mutase